MTVEQIEKFLTNNEVPEGKIIRFELKRRDPVRGLFVKGRDFEDLKTKNFWRIVPQSRLAAFQKSADISLARIFVGSDFQKLTFVSNKSEE